MGAASLDHTELLNGEGQGRQADSQALRSSGCGGLRDCGMRLHRLSAQKGVTLLKHLQPADCHTNDVE